jgi:hypothetical protein
VTVPIDFDSQLHLGTVEIQHVPSDRVLTSKAQTKQLPLPKLNPQLNLWQVHMLAQLARSFE